MIYYSFNVLAISLIVLIVGMIKPKWILLWMEKPGRIAIVCISGAIFMAGMVMFGEGNKQLQQEKAQQSKEQAVQPTQSADEVPLPAATPATTAVLPKP